MSATLAAFAAVGGAATVVGLGWRISRRIGLLRAALRLQITLTEVAESQRDHLARQLQTSQADLKRAIAGRDQAEHDLALVRGELWVMAKPGDIEITDARGSIRTITEEEVKGRAMTRRLQVTVHDASFVIPEEGRYPRFVNWQGMSWILKETRIEQDYLSGYSPHHDRMDARVGLQRSIFELEAYVEGGDRGGEFSYRLSR